MAKRKTLELYRFNGVQECVFVDARDIFSAPKYEGCIGDKYWLLSHVAVGSGFCYQDAKRQVIKSSPVRAIFVQGDVLEVVTKNTIYKFFVIRNDTPERRGAY